jgi:hypothetical protein
MSENLVLDLSMQFAVEIVNLCESMKGKSALTNDCRYGRRVLVMAVSDDMDKWRIAHIIEGDPNINNAFSYADFFFSGDDIYLLSRTGYNGTPNLHDTNMVTFHKVLNFRQYI